MVFVKNNLLIFIKWGSASKICEMLSRIRVSKNIVYGTPVHMGHMLKLLNEQNKIVLCMKPEY